MAEIKYGKYFFNYEPKPEEIKLGRTGIARLDNTSVDNTSVEGSFFYWVHWNLPGSVTPPAGHPPHIHRDAEILMLIGTNPDEPTDLGAEVELFMGPEMERHVMTKSTVVFIPPNFIHCPYIIKRIDRPWIFVEVNQGPVHTEKSFRQLLPIETREKIDWSRWQDEGY